CALPQALEVLEQPLDLRRGEVRVEHEPRVLTNEPLASLLAELGATSGGSPVLPHDRPLKRLARVRIPYAHRLALVGDPHRLELAALKPGVPERLARDGSGHLPDLVRIVLHPSRSREVL